MKQQYPHTQSFKKPTTKGSVVPKNLASRQADYVSFTSKGKIGDGHRDVRGYHKPGSNKK